MALIYSTDLTDTSAISSGSVIKIPEGQTMTLHNTAVRSIEKVTLLIDGSLQLADDIVMPDHSAIILSATGSIAPAPDCSGSVKLTGQNTRFSAPPVCVFSPDVKVDGTWLMDKAYVAWFDQSDAVEKFGQNTRSDDAGAIDTALSMAPPGEVLLEAKTYTINSAIHIPVGRILVGNSCITYDGISATTPRTIIERNYPTAAKETGDNKYEFFEDYCVYMNIKPNTTSWEYAYPFPGTGMRDIAFKFKCMPMITDPQTGEDIRIDKPLLVPCILAGGGFTLSNIRWSGFYQAVKVTDNYADQRTIRSCFFGFNPMNDDFVIPKGYSFPELYAFDLFALGDAQEIDQLSVDHPYGALKIGYNGTSVHDSIINGSVLIQTARACALRNIHMEQPTAGFPRDVAINVIDSSVSISDCNFELGYRTFVNIKNGDYQNSNIVTLTNCCFVYNAGIRGKLKQPAPLPNNYSGTPNDYRIRNTSEFDINIDLYSLVNISNCYRFTIPGSNYSFSMITSGLWLSYTNPQGIIKPFTEFNTASNSYSLSSSICDLRISSCVTQPAESGSTLNPVVEVYHERVNVPNEGLVNTGWYTWVNPIPLATTLHQTVKYGYRFLNSNDSIASAIAQDDFNSPTEYKVGDLYGQEIPIINVDQAIRIVVNAYNPRWNTRVLIKRTITQSSITLTQYAYIPICGTRMLYDNGFAINGYKWYPVEEFISHI